MDIAKEIREIWDRRQSINWNEDEDAKSTVMSVIRGMDSGEYKVVEKFGSEWVVNGWTKEAILLYFSFRKNKVIEVSDGMNFYDKVGLKFAGWTAEDFQKSKIRVVPGCVVREGAYVGQNTVLMPSFINIGAHVGDKTLIDTWATVGSCAYVGKSCHISGGAGLGGVLEPIQSQPVIIEDNCFIGARSEVVEGVFVGEGSVISMGVFLGMSTKIIDRATKNELPRGVIPPYSVVIPGTTSGEDGQQLYCAVIAKKVDAQTRSKVPINELLRSSSEA